MICCLPVPVYALKKIFVLFLALSKINAWLDRKAFSKTGSKSKLCSLHLKQIHIVNGSKTVKGLA